MTTDDTRRSDGQGLSEAERAELHQAMAAWAKVMPYNHLGLDYGLSDGIWTRLDGAVERILAARGGNTDNTLRARIEEALRYPYNDDRVRRVRAALDAAPAPTDNQRDDGVAERVKALADEWAAQGREVHRPRILYAAAASRLRAVVDGATTGDGEGA